MKAAIPCLVLALLAVSLSPLTVRAEEPICATAEPTDACREFCAANPNHDRCKEYCARWPADRLCAPTVDCRNYPESSHESNVCSRSHTTGRCQIYCECHPLACANPPPPEDCSRFPRNDGDDRRCHENRETSATRGTCGEYCSCNPATCDNPPPINCSRYPESATRSNDCANSRALMECQIYCECHPESCANPPPPADCSIYPRSDMDDRFCQERPNDGFCLQYCACNRTTCDNPPPVDCRQQPISAGLTSQCSTSTYRDGFICQMYCECHPDLCANPPPPRSCAPFRRTDETDRRCHEHPDAFASGTGGSCFEYCFCNPESCERPAQPPDCTLYPRDATGLKDIACSAVPDFGDCPQYCLCNSGACSSQGPPEFTPTPEYCAQFPWDPACFCPGMMHLAECKAYCHLHPRRCNPELILIPPELLFPRIRDNIFPFCEKFPDVCRRVIVDSSVCSVYRQLPVCAVRRRAVPLPKKISPPLLKKPVLKTPVKSPVPKTAPKVKIPASKKLKK